MKVLSIAASCMSLLMPLAFSPSNINEEKMLSSICEPSEPKASTPYGYKGNKIFRQFYQSSVRKEFTTLSEDDYEQLAAVSKGNKVLVKTQGEKTFQKVIQYSKKIDKMDRKEYEYVNKILSKYE